MLKNMTNKKTSFLIDISTCAVNRERTQFDNKTAADRHKARLERPWRCFGLRGENSPGDASDNKANTKVK